MKIRAFLSFVLLFISWLGTGQEAVITVLDQEFDPIPNAHVLVMERNKYLITDMNGKVAIGFDQEPSLTIEVSFIGHHKLQKVIRPNENVKIYLESNVSELKPFVVTGQYSANDPEKAVQRITIIDKKKIEKMAAVSLKDVLANEMNITLSEDNILGSGMSIQGLGGENVKILIDGVPMIGRLNGNIDLSQINLNDIERIEIIQGPMSVNFGTNSLAGVINLITKSNKGKTISTSANSYYENIGKYNVDGGVSFSEKKHTISIGGGRNYFDGWIEGDQLFGEPTRIADSSRFKSWKPKEQLFGKVSYNYKLNEGNIKYAFRYFDEKITNKGLPRNPYGETAFDDYYYTTRMDHSLFHQQRINETDLINTTLAYNDFTRIKNTYFKDLTTLEQSLSTNEGAQDTTRFNQWILRSSYSTSNDSLDVNFQIGIDFNHEEAFGRRIKDQTQALGDYAVYGSVEYQPTEKWIIRPGLRYAYNTVYQAPLTPSINFKYHTDKGSLRASYAKGFRAPSLKELYFDFVDINHNIQGDTNLVAEQSHNASLSYSYSKSIKNRTHKVEATTFYNQIYNLITLALVDGTQYTYVNIGNFQTHGMQLNYSLSYIHTKINLSGSYTGRYNFLSEDSPVERFSYTPEWRCNINQEFPKTKWFASLFYKYSGRLPGFAVDGDDNVIATYIDSYHTADVSVGKHFWNKRLQVLLGSKNILNVTNVNAMVQGTAHSGSSGSAPIGMGRTYFVKMTLNFDHEKKDK